MTTERPDRELYWVGIGASAGGLEAIKTLVQSFPENANLIYIVAQHLSPNHKSMMTELVQRKAKVKVETVQDGCRPVPNTMYITPPQMDVTVVGDELRLNAASEHAVPKPSVNSLFVSLAEEKKELAIGIVLSGTGSDGAHGIKKIRAMGGLTIAQAPNTATYDGMPVAAIRTDCVDLVLTPEEIGQHLQKLSSHNPGRQQLVLEQAEVKDNLSELLTLVREQCGVSFKQYKKATLRRRIERRMLACGFNDFEKYVYFAKEHIAEVQLLFKDVLISVTEFFRDLPHFEALSQTIADILQDKGQQGPIRFWSVGCATGEEAYSLAILLAEALGGPEKLAERNYQIFATDVDTDALTVARRGIYDHASMVNMPEQYIEKYFIKRNDTYEVIKPIKDIMLFAAHNIIEDPPFLRIDLISCRNLLIYFEPELQKKIYSIFHYALRPKSYMFLGKSESITQAAQLFHPIQAHDKIFQRRSGPSVRSEVLFKGQARPLLRAQEKKETEKSSVPHLHDSLVRQLGDASILINDNFDIEHIYGDATPYISLANGKPVLNLADIINNVHKQEIRALAFKALRTNDVVTGQPRKIKIEGKLHQDRLIIYPLKNENENERYLLVCFERLGRVMPKKTSAGEIDSDRINELESELATAKEHLQTVIEELETSNEELQSLNEELQSSNEELQSSNEELETTNEELQSANEELVTMNDELNSKTVALEQTTSQLVNVKNSLSYPLIVVDEQLRIIISNKKARRVFDFSGNGDEISAVLGHLDDHSIILELVRSVLNRGVVKEIQLEEKGRFYWLNIAPFSQNDRSVSGVILSFTDNTDIVRKNIDLIESRKRAQAANVAKTEFLANVSHEIRTPLNAIYGVMEIYKLTLGDDEKHKKLLKVLENSAITLKDLLNDLLDFAKLEAGKLQLERVAFSLRDLLDKIIDVYSLQATEKGIDLALDIDQRMSDTYIGDPLRIHQIVANLLSNALKFTKDGAVKLRVSSWDKGDVTNVQIKVSDTGIGIREEELQRIFDKFSQSDTSISRRYGGTGLGLAIVKELVHLMNGSIDLQSKVNNGTTFTITLPLIKHNDQQQALPSPQNNSSSSPKRTLDVSNSSLLIVEDNISNIFILSSYLDQLGCRYDVAESGQQGLNLIRKKSYDCIFLDIQMDEMDGFQFYDRLRAYEAEQRAAETPVIAVSGNVQKSVIERAIKVGMKTFISKPIEMSKLEQALADHVFQENLCNE